MALHQATVLKIQFLFSSDTWSLLVQIGSAAIQFWEDSDRYSDVVTEGTGDQKAIMEAICMIKKASFDGVDCVGGDPDATGTVRVLPSGTKNIRDTRIPSVLSTVLK